MNIGIAIRKIRLDKDINQGDLAKLCDISQNSISQIELGLKKPNPKNLRKICKVLEVPESILYLYSLEEKDIPERKKETYKTLFPVFQSMVKSLVLD